MKQSSKQSASLAAAGWGCDADATAIPTTGAATSRTAAAKNDRRVDVTDAADAADVLVSVVLVAAEFELGDDEEAH